MQELIIGAIYLVHSPSVVAMLDGEELNNEEWLNRSALICPVEISQDGSEVKSRIFHFSTRKFDDCSERGDAFDMREAITLEELAELDAWSKSEEWNLTFDVDFFVNHDSVSAV